MESRLGRAAHLAFCTLVFIFLVVPIVVIVPLSFNAEPYFTFTEGMLRLDPEAWSLRWYREVLDNELWTRGLANSFVIGVSATLIATALGTLAALGLASPAMPARRFITGLLISPMVTPVDHLRRRDVLLLHEPGARPDPPRAHPRARHARHALRRDHGRRHAVRLRPQPDARGGQPGRRPGAHLPHRAAAADRPGVVSGALFAFATSFDEVVVVLFMGGVEQRTIPRQMWAGIREQISPAILAVATFLIVFAVALLLTVAWLRRRATA